MLVESLMNELLYTCHVCIVVNQKQHIFIQTAKNKKAQPSTHVLEAVKLPALVTGLDTGLAQMDRDALAHGWMWLR